MTVSGKEGESEGRKVSGREMRYVKEVEGDDDSGRGDDGDVIVKG